MKAKFDTKKTILLLFILIFVVNLVFRIYSFRSEYSQKFDPKYWENRYLQSQWVVSGSKNSIGDDGLYTYAAWEYIQGKDPTTVNAETPPLGKYLIGLSILIFGNQNIFAVLVGIIALFCFYILNSFVFRDKLLAFLPVVLFSLEPLYYTQLRAPFLDLLQLTFLFLSLLFLLKEKILLSMIFLGFMASTKSSAMFLILVSFTVFSYLVIFAKKDLIKKFFLYLPIPFIVYTLTYFRFFWLGHSFWEFLKVQKWIINFYLIGAKGVFGSVWQMILTGIWPAWWSSTIIRVNEWQISWPILLFLSFIFFVIAVKSWWKNAQFLLFGFWIIFYLFALSFIPIWPRYLLLMLPFMYNLSIWVLSKNIRERS